MLLAQVLYQIKNSLAHSKSIALVIILYIDKVNSMDFKFGLIINLIHGFNIYLIVKIHRFGQTHGSVGNYGGVNIWINTHKSCSNLLSVFKFMNFMKIDGFNKQSSMDFVDFKCILCNILEY